MTTSMAHESPHAALTGCGARLRAAREAAGLTIEDAARRLRVPAHVVRALEQENWACLGAPVFVRGQVRSYARLLGLGTSATLEALDVGPVEPTPLVSHTHTSKVRWWAEQIGRRLIYIALTLSLAIPAWMASRHHFAPAAATNVVPLDASPGTPSVAKAGVAAGTAATPRTVAASLAPLAVETDVPAQPSEGDGILLRTQAKTWLQVTGRDGTTLEQTLLPAGSERRYRLADVGGLVIGDASAVRLEVQGRAVDATAHARANVARFAVSSEGALVAAD